jgi:hypothetical protein
VDIRGLQKMEIWDWSLLINVGKEGAGQ